MEKCSGSILTTICNFIVQNLMRMEFPVLPNSNGGSSIPRQACRFRNRREVRRRLPHSIRTLTPVLGGRHSGMHLEGAIEWPDRTKTGVEGDGEDRDARLAGIAERSHGLGKAVAVDEGAEIAMSQFLIDQSAQPVF